eukprot:9893290-Ditylum_brightwellii.AAC.1
MDTETTNLPTALPSSIVRYAESKQCTTTETVPARWKDIRTMQPLTTAKVVATGEFQGDNKGLAYLIQNALTIQEISTHWDTITKK